MLFNRRVGKMVVPNSSYALTESGQLFVIGNAKSATMDFYFRGRSVNGRDITILNTESFDKLVSSLTVIPPGGRVILVRDVPLACFKVLESIRPRLSGVSWFIDDDIPGIAEDKTLPSFYRKRLSTWYGKAYSLLERLCDQIWVSTPYLAHKYGLPEQSVIPPLEPQVKVSHKLVRCFYHGSSSHTQEWSFIREVVATVQARNACTWFELIGDHALYKLFRGIPRVNILHPMPWADYLVMTSERSMDIGLAPLMETPFNLARSHTKFLDITRQGAVGIYSELFSNAELIRKQGAGLVVRAELSDWIDAIEALLEEDRSAMLAQARALLHRWQSDFCGLPASYPA